MGLQSAGPLRTSVIIVAIPEKLYPTYLERYRFLNSLPHSGRTNRRGTLWMPTSFLHYHPPVCSSSPSASAPPSNQTMLFKSLRRRRRREWKQLNITQHWMAMLRRSCWIQGMTHRPRCTVRQTTLLPGLTPIGQTSLPSAIIDSPSPFYGVKQLTASPARPGTVHNRRMTSSLSSCLASRRTSGLRGLRDDTATSPRRSRRWFNKTSKNLLEFSSAFRVKLMFFVCANFRIPWILAQSSVGSTNCEIPSVDRVCSSPGICADCLVRRHNAMHLFIQLDDYRVYIPEFLTCKQKRRRKKNLLIPCSNQAFTYTVVVR